MFRSSLKLFKDVAMAKRGPLDPLIVIIGATGTGKSQVSVTRTAVHVDLVLIPQ
jgi:Tfp pilus assembly ATPase PilU